MDSDSEYEPEYELESITIGPMVQQLQFKVLSVVPPPLEYMSSLHSKREEISGRQVWCGSYLLSQYLISERYSADKKPSIEGKRVLELGCGTGLLGMVAARNQSPCVALTDGDEEALKLVRVNLENDANLLPRGIAYAKYLRWGEEESYDDFSTWCREKWPTMWKDNVDFDVILAGDVLYKDDLPVLFFNAVNRFLSNSSTLYLCHIPRANVGHDVVINTAKQKGFAVEKIPLDKNDFQANQDFCPVEDLERAAIYKITRIT